MSFFSELKRRNVFRVGAAYLVVSWLLLQIADTLVSILSLSDAFSRAVFFVLVIGFPIAVIISWVYELTPKGLQTQAEVDQTGATTYSSKLNTVIISGLVLVLVLVVLDAYILRDSNESSESAELVLEEGQPVLDEEIIATGDLEKSIAVLPFSNLSPDPDQEYFSDGLTEELLNKLAQVQDLQVAGRTSSFYFKGKNEDLREIGEQLGVNYLMEGSVRKAGDQLRITAQLIRADNGFHLWSDTYDRNMEDIFAIQDEIAIAVTEALSISLGAGEFDLPGMTRNVQAYDALIKAREIVLNDLAREGLLLSIEEIKRALELDPEFAFAWLFLGNIYGQASRLLPPSETGNFLALSDDAFDKAKALAPNMVQLRIGEVYSMFVNGEWLEAESIIEQLFAEYRGSNGEINNAYGMFLNFAGRNEDALIQFQNSIRLDPLEGGRAVGSSLTLIALGRLEEAREEIQRGLDSGEVVAAHNANMIRIAIETRDWVFLRQAIANGNSVIEDVLGRAIDALENGNNQEAVAILVAAINDPDVVPVRILLYCEFLATLGEYELVLDILLEKDPRNTGGFVFDIWYDSFTGVRLLPGFKDYLENIGLVEYWEVSGNWPDKCRPLEGGDDFECF